jgi:PAS domain S-box-containing protein
VLDASRLGLLMPAGRDMTGRPEVDGPAAQQRGLDEATLDVAGALIVVLDADWHIVRFNRQCEQVSGYRRCDVMGRHYEFLVPAADRAEVAGILEPVSSDAPVSHVSRLLTKDGQLRVIRWSIAALAGPDGRRAHLVAAGVDITEQQREEDERSARAQELEGAERELTQANAELARANAQLARSNADLEQFAFVASHDLREPLQAIALPIQFLAERYKGRLDESADEFLRYAVDGCQRMDDRIRGLLALSRVSRPTGSRRPTDTGQVVKQAVATLNAALDGTHAVVVTVEPLPVVVAEPDLLAQVFENLIGNAVKFVKAGVVPEVTISAARVARGWRFEVTDNGIGIPKRSRELVFAMFKRLPTAAAYQGTGIGLAMVKTIVERHGGEVGVEAAPAGTGSTFWFTLPTEAAQDAGDTEPAVPTVARSREPLEKE